MPKVISLKEFRLDLPRIVEQVSGGQSFMVVKRSRPVFQINPVADEGKWETVIDFTEISPEGVDIDLVLEALAKK